MSGEAGRGRGTGLGTVALELAAYVVLYVAVEADDTTVQAWRMRGWHYTRRAAWALSYRASRVGLFAERRYNQVMKG